MQKELHKSRCNRGAVIVGGDALEDSSVNSRGDASEAVLEELH